MLTSELQFTYNSYTLEVSLAKPMSKQRFIKTIRMELDKLNQDIDLKIIKGLSYARESRRHKMLMSELRKITRQSGFFGRLASAFIF